MKVVYIVIQLLYGFLMIEVSDSFMVSYNYYEGESNPKDFLIIDYSSDNYYEIENKTKKVNKLESLRSVVKEEVIYTEKVKDTLFLENFECRVIAEHTRLKKPSTKMERIQGDILMLKELKLGSKNYSFIPCLGSSFADQNVFNFACYYVIDNRYTLFHEVIEIEERQGFSEIATEMINLIK